MANRYIMAFVLCMGMCCAQGVVTGLSYVAHVFTRAMTTVSNEH